MVEATAAGHEEGVPVRENQPRQIRAAYETGLALGRGGARAAEGVEQVLVSPSCASAGLETHRDFWIIETQTPGAR
jgi:hypothetical protein